MSVCGVCRLFLLMVVPVVLPGGTVAAPSPERLGQLLGARRAAVGTGRVLRLWRRVLSGFPPMTACASDCGLLPTRRSGRPGWSVPASAPARGSPSGHWRCGKPGAGTLGRRGTEPTP